MRLATSAIAAFAAGIALFSSSADAALIAYEGFNYPTAGASVVGQVDSGPDASFGWSAGWADNTTQTNVEVQGPVYVNSTGMSYSKSGIPLQVSGGKVEQLDEDTYLPYRLFTNSIGGTGSLANPVTVWASVLIQNYGRNSTTPTYDPTLANADTFFLWGTSAGVNQSASPGSTNAAYLGGSRNSGSTFAGGTGGAGVANFAGSGLNGNAHLLVQRVVFGGGSTTSNMKVDTWFDPTPGLDPSTNPGSFSGTVTGSSIANLLFAGMFFRGMETGKGAFDEIRVGDTALDVLPVGVPEPTAAVLVIAGALGLIRLRAGRR